MDLVYACASVLDYELTIWEVIGYLTQPNIPP